MEQENGLLKATNDRLKTENDKHNKRVEMLEKALCSKIFKSGLPFIAVFIPFAMVNFYC